MEARGQDHEAALATQHETLTAETAAVRTELAGLQVVEVPITFVERAEGDSKMSADITREAIVNVARWGVTARAKVLGDKAQRLLGR